MTGDNLQGSTGLAATAWLRVQASLVTSWPSPLPGFPSSDAGPQHHTANSTGT